MKPCQYADESSEPCTDTRPEYRLVWPMGGLLACSDHVDAALRQARALGLVRVSVELLPADAPSRTEMAWGRR